MRTLLYIGLILLTSSLLYAQRPVPSVSNLNLTRDSILQAPRNASDSIPLVAPSSTSDIPMDIQYADDALDAEIEYHARDSAHNYVRDHVIHLFGEAYAKYQDFELNADKIIFDKKNNLLIAEARQDSTGRWVGLPHIKDGEQEFRAKKIKYNYETKKGIITDVTTQENDLYVHSGKLKYIRSEERKGEVENIICSENSLITTCNHPHPHFGIRSRKQKVIANKVVVVGPSNIEIEGVATPLWIPFGFFPITKGQRSGLIIPSDYENSDKFGFGLKDIGYYWAISDKMDLKLLGAIYTRGSWVVKANMRYNVRYKYNGSLNLEYSWLYDKERAGEIGRDLNKSFVLGWTFNQDRAANPNYSFSANVTLNINKGIQRTSNNYRDVHRNITSSNITFRKPIPKRGMFFTANIGFTQNIQTSSLDMAFPSLKLTANRFFPFKNKKRTGKKQWYEDISMTYNSELKNRVNTKDSLLFTPQVFDDLKYGMIHKTNMSTTLNVMKNFRLTPRADYSEAWLPKSMKKDYNGETTKVDTTYHNGFHALRQFNAAVNLSADVYSTLQFKRGKIQGLRYKMTPSIGFSYTPDYTQDGWGYVDSYQKGEQEIKYSIYEGNVFGASPSQAGKQMNLTYSIQNNFDLKYKSWNKKDSTETSKIIKLFNSINVSGFYNFAADSLKFSTVSASGSMQFFQNMTTVFLRASFDPYVKENNERVNITSWEKDGKLLRFDYLTTNITTTLSWNKIQQWLGMKKQNSNNGSLSPPRKKNLSSRRSTIKKPFIKNLSISHSYSLRTTSEKTSVQNNSLGLQASFQLSTNWAFNVNNINYNFKTKNLVYPDFSLSRDLHCWEMGLSWYPQRDSYNFYLRVKPGSLGFLNLPWSRNQYSGNFR